MKRDMNGSPVPPELFRARSVVIVGASGDPSKLGSRPLENLRKVGYRGEIYLVNPKGGEIDGLKCYASVAELPATPEVALLVVPGKHALQAAEQCADRGVKAAVVASTGFAEAGEEGLRLQQAIAALAQRGLRIVGPNTNGIYNAHERFSLGYNSAHAEVFEPGPVSIISHSGAVFNVIAERMKAQGLGLSKFIPVGNEADLDMLDFLEYMIEDEATDVVLLIVEALRDGERFRRIAERLRAAGKRVAAVKLGTSRAGSASTAAHSSRLAGNMRAYSALLEAAGVGRATSIEGLVAFARLAIAAPPGWAPQAARALGIITASGAGGTLLADVAANHDFGVAALDAGTRSGLAGFNESAASFNPMDVGNFGGSAHTPTTGPLVSLDQNVDAVLVFGHTLQTAARREAYASGVVAGAKSSAKPHMVLAPGGLPPEQTRMFEQGGVPVFGETASMFEGLRALYTASAEPPSAAHALREVERCGPVAGLAGLPAGDLNEFDSMAVLDRAGLPTVPRVLVHSAEEAVRAAEKLGWPVVLKGVVDGVAHKSDLGLVHLNLRSAAEVSAAFAALRTAVAGLDGEAARLVACVQKMVRGELEILVGVTTEAPLGRFLVAGWGGRHAEQIDDVRLWPIPVTAVQLREGLAATAPGRALQGPRWGDSRAFDQLVDALMRLQALALAAGSALQAVEINPLGASREGVTAMDALVVIAQETGESA
jgi:acyl-CoA synthetase (NDP forming)